MTSLTKTKDTKGRLDRRSFLRGTAASAAGLAIAPGLIAGAASRSVC